MNDIRKQTADSLLQELSDRGQIVEGGWKAYELLSGLNYSPDIQRYEYRKAFFLGAQHVFSSIIRMLDPGLEPTDLDLERMNKLNTELNQFVKELK